MGRRRCLGRAALVAALGALIVACGQKGPPLAPLRLVPAAVTDLSLGRVEEQARLQFVLPTRNANGPGPVELDRIEVFAVTVAAGSPAPPNRDLLTRAYLVGQVPVRPAPATGQEPTADDPRPGPGEVATFEEQLTGEALTPVAFTPDPAAGEPAPATAAAPAPQVPGQALMPTGLDPANRLVVEKPAAAADASAESPDAASALEPEPVPPPDGTVPAPPGSARADPAARPAAAAAPVRKEPVRIYVVRGVTRGGRPGAPSARVELPMSAVPPPPTALDARITEESVILEWTPPEEVSALAYTVYEGDDDLRPMHPKPLATPGFEHPVRFGEERCYRVRSASVAGAVLIEGPPSAPLCITPEDIFPPAAPGGLAAVSTPGQISLIWDANGEPDLAGYLILRGAAPDGQLQPLVTAPIRETSFRDTTVVPGVRYIYAVVAVDTATPPNMSAMSERVEETAR
jgi:hypothetical protein